MLAGAICAFAALTHGADGRSRAGEVSCTQFGCIADGAPHRVGDTNFPGLPHRIATLRELNAYTDPAGAHPYARIGQQPYGVYRALPVLQATATGVASIAFNTAIEVAAPGTALGDSFVPVASMGFGPIRPGMACAGNGIATGARIVLYNPHARIIELDQPVGAKLPAGAKFSCGTDLADLAAGASVRGPGIAPGTVVLRVDNTPGRQSVILSHAMLAQAPALTPLEFWSSYSDAQIAAAQMDWVGVQAALAETHAKGGGTVHLPAGIYRMGALGLVQPDSRETGTDAHGVDLVGDGAANTHLTWSGDPGAGAFLLTSAFRLTDANQNKGLWSGFDIEGPGKPVAAGMSGAQADGLGEGGHRHIVGVSVSRTHACLAVTSDQTEFERLDLRDCYYGVYFDLPNGYGNFGDHLFLEIGMSNMGMAGVACSATYCSVGDTWMRSGIFGAPFGFYKETAEGSGSLLLHRSTIIGMQMEGIGMSAVGDDQPPGAARADADSTRFENLELAWDATGSASIASGPRSKSSHAALFELDTCHACSIDPIAEPQLWKPGTDGIFAIHSGDMALHGDIDALVANVEAAKPPYARQFWSDRSNPSDWMLQGNGWQGRACSKCFVAPGHVVAFEADGATGLSTGLPSETAVGVSKFAEAQNQVVATGGHVEVLAGGNIAGFNVPLRSGPGGTVLQASGADDRRSPGIGTASSPATAAGQRLWVTLRNLQ